jgi:hypothetical protein
VGVGVEGKVNRDVPSKVLNVLGECLPLASRIVMQLCFRPCRRTFANLARLSKGLKWQLTTFCAAIVVMKTRLQPTQVRGGT